MDEKTRKDENYMKKKTNSQAVSDYRRNRKLNLITACGNKCCICGYSKAVSALEFHHIDPSKKEFGIASNGTCHNIQKDIAEIRKCALVCSNCHREIHEEMFSIDDLYKYQYFDEEFITQLLTPSKRSQIRFCSECGAKIHWDNESGLCEICVRKKTRKVERPNREEMKELLQKHSFVELGRIFGVSDNSIRKWCKAYNLPSRKIDILQVQDWSKI